MSELREKVLRENITIRKLKEELFKKWEDCFKECYNKSYYKAKCGTYSFGDFCERKHKGSE